MIPIEADVDGKVEKGNQFAETGKKWKDFQVRR